MQATDSPTRPLTEAARLADLLERSFRGGAWHGPAFAETLAGVDAATAARRPIAGAHTIREIVDHVSFWLERSHRRIADESVEDLPLDEDWAPSDPGEGQGGRETEAEKAWHRALSTVAERHRRLHALVAGLDDSRLDDPVDGSEPTVRGLLLGIVQHHAYHGGQIALLRKAGGAP